MGGLVLVVLEGCDAAFTSSLEAIKFYSSVLHRILSGLHFVVNCVLIKTVYFQLLRNNQNTDRKNIRTKGLFNN